MNRTLVMLQCMLAVNTWYMLQSMFTQPIGGEVICSIVFWGLMYHDLQIHLEASRDFGFFYVNFGSFYNTHLSVGRSVVPVDDLGSVQRLSSPHQGCRGEQNPIVRSASH